METTKKQLIYNFLSACINKCDSNITNSKLFSIEIMEIKYYDDFIRVSKHPFKPNIIKFMYNNFKITMSPIFEITPEQFQKLQQAYLYGTTPDILNYFKQ